MNNQSLLRKEKDTNYYEIMNNNNNKNLDDEAVFFFNEPNNNTNNKNTIRRGNLSLFNTIKSKSYKNVEMTLVDESKKLIVSENFLTILS